MSRSWLEPVRFDYAVSTGGLAAVRLVAEVDAALGPPSQACILARRADLRSRHAPCASRMVIDEVLVWEVSFRLPLELFEYPRALFDLEASDRIAIALPAPGLRADATELIAAGAKSRRRPLLRRSAIGLATGLALAAGSDAFVGRASAASAPMHTAKHRAAAGAHQAARTTPASTSSPSPTTTLTTSTTTVSRTTTTVTATTVTHTSPRVPAKPHGGAKQSTSAASPRTKAATTVPSSGTSTRRPPTKSDTARLAGCALTTIIVGNIKASKTEGQTPRRSEAGHQTARRETKSACVAPHHPTKKREHAPRKPAVSLLPARGGAALMPVPQPLSLRRESRNNVQEDLERSVSSPTPARAMPVSNSQWTAGVGIDPSTAPEMARFATVSASLDQPPAFLVPIYTAAGRRYDIPWQILAAINAVETNYGQDLAVSPKGAIGWMQFMPGTWIEYGIDASGSGRPNPYDPRDAIFSAARLLAANGGAGDIRRALFAYNHALWYVDAVLWRAALITDRVTGRENVSAVGNTTGYVNPLTFVTNWERTDQGVDATMPIGAPILAPDEVKILGIEPAWFDGQPLVWWELLSGPDAGQYQYVAEQIQDIAPVGSILNRGQTIAVYAPSGTGIEYGWATAGGETLAMASTGYIEGYATAAGEWMRNWLNLLGANAGTGVGLSIGAGPDTDDRAAASELEREAAVHAITTPGYTSSPRSHRDRLVTPS